MRDLIEKASLGTPGRHKVYILDEVHMLTPAAEAALLKTLEEPPPHVVFVLATTDPQRVRDTIRSRTQHLRFHLLPADELTEHVRWVATDAGLDVDDAAIDAAVAQGAGSVRDTLSALELIANAGGDAGDTLSFSEVVEALIEHDPGRALTAMAHAVNAGYEPRTLAEALVRHLRDGFLSLMAPELVQLATPQVDELAAQAQRLGPAALVRAIERLGEILVELRHAPDPRVLVEVALVQLTTPPPPAADDIGALAARVTKLEQAAAEGPAPPARHRSIRAPVARRWAGGPVAPRRRAAARSAAPDPAARTCRAGERPGGRRRRPCPTPREWDQVKPSLQGIVRALFTPLEVVGAAPGAVTLAAPNATHRDKCVQHRAAVEQAWQAATGHAVTVDVVLGDGASDAQTPAGAMRPGPATRRGPDPRAADAHADIDLDDLVDAPPGTVTTTLDRLAQAFPGAELIEESDCVTSAYSPPVQALIDELGRLPGIGPKSAQRIAFHLLKIPADDVARLAGAITEAKAKVRFCPRCFNVTDSELCSFCTDDRRDTASCASSRSPATSSPSSAPASSTAATTCCSGR